MLTRKELADARERAARIFAATGIALTDAERAAIEIADFGLSKLEETGLEIVVYVNTDRVAAKELAMFPRQICPEHRHPPFDGTPGEGGDLPLPCGHGVRVHGRRAGGAPARPGSRRRDVHRLARDCASGRGAVHGSSGHAALVSGGGRGSGRLRVLHPEPGRPGYLQRSKDRAGHPAGRRMTLDPPSSCWHRFLPNQDEARLTPSASNTAGSRRPNAHLGTLLPAQMRTRLARRGGGSPISWPGGRGACSP